MGGSGETTISIAALQPLRPTTLGASHLTDLGGCLPLVVLPVQLPPTPIVVTVARFGDFTTKRLRFRALASPPV
jgi:hypothetical protein